MKLIDRYKLSLHNIKNNKSRSILTTIIVFIISLLMTFILAIGLSFSINSNEIIKKYYQDSGEPITYSYYDYEENNNKINSNNYDTLRQILINNEMSCSYITYDINLWHNFQICDYYFPLNEFYTVIEGSDISDKYTNTNKVLVSSDFAHNYYNQNNIKLNPNDKINYKLEINTSNNYNNIEEVNIELEVMGIFIPHKSDVSDTGLINQSTDIIIDINYLLQISPEIYLSSFNGYYNVVKSNFNNDELKENLIKFNNELNGFIKNISRDKEVYCGALIDIQMATLISVIVISLALILCLILILLSIGSLANTIMISVDKNKKFIGLLKALGLNERDLKSVIKMESITTIVLGVLLSFLVMYLFKGIITDINVLVIDSMFSYYISKIDYEITYNLPIYIPLIVIAFFVTFTLIFARGSMSKIAKTDPMAVISEVA